MAHINQFDRDKEPYREEEEKEGKGKKTVQNKAQERTIYRKKFKCSLDLGRY